MIEAVEQVMLLNRYLDQATSLPHDAGVPKCKSFPTFAKCKMLAEDVLYWRVGA